LLGEVTSTLDVAHSLASEGAPAGTLIVADAQRQDIDRRCVARPLDQREPDPRARLRAPAATHSTASQGLRIGLALAPALDAFTATPVRLKWPNDLYVGERKLAGVLIEARWRDAQPEWLAIGVGINLRPPASEPRAVGLRPGVTRDDVLPRIVPAMRAAAACGGLLTESELRAFATRDLARGHRCIAPVDGVVHGIDRSGELLVDVALTGDAAHRTQLTAVRAGSLVLAEEGLA
jgi:BirA family biotin operon repressor/biotin-[acetyl-CoA-carboxylase] ligase